MHQFGEKATIRQNIYFEFELVFIFIKLDMLINVKLYIKAGFYKNADKKM